MLGSSCFASPCLCEKKERLGQRQTTDFRIHAQATIKLATAARCRDNLRSGLKRDPNTKPPRSWRRWPRSKAAWVNARATRERQNESPDAATAAQSLAFVHPSAHSGIHYSMHVSQFVDHPDLIAFCQSTKRSTLGVPFCVRFNDRTSALNARRGTSHLELNFTIGPALDLRHCSDLRHCHQRRSTPTRFTRHSTSRIQRDEA